MLSWNPPFGIFHFVEHPFILYNITKSEFHESTLSLVMQKGDASAEDLKEYVSYYLDRLDGLDAVNAFHSLIEAPKEAIPLLVEAYHQQTCSSIRATIVEIISKFRDPTTVPFLAAALSDDSELIWKEALDALVALGGNKALKASIERKTTCLPPAKRLNGFMRPLNRFRKDLLNRSIQRSGYTLPLKFTLLHSDGSA